MTLVKSLRMFSGIPEQDPLVRCTDPAPDPSPDPSPIPSPDPSPAPDPSLFSSMCWERTEITPANYNFNTEF